MNMATCLWIGIGGFLGANARYGLSLWVAARWGTAFPWGTLLINVSGSFVLCVLLVLASHHTAFPPTLRLALTTGFLGAYTTFSTFSAEWLLLCQDGYGIRSMLYVVSSVVGGGLAGVAGLWLGRWL